MACFYKWLDQDYLFLEFKSFIKIEFKNAIQDWAFYRWPEVV